METRPATPVATTQEDTISIFDDGRIHVITQPNCGPCIGVIRRLKKALGDEGFEKWVEVHDISKDEEVGDFARGLGYHRTPVTYFRGNHFSGFVPETLDEYSRTIAREPAAA